MTVKLIGVTVVVDLCHCVCTTPSISISKVTSEAEAGFRLDMKN